MDGDEAPSFKRNFKDSKWRRWDACITGHMSDCTFLVAKTPATNEDGDIIESVDGWVKFTCHKMILATASEVFERMLYGEFGEDVITIEDVSPKVFRQFLQYVYIYKLDSIMLNMEQCLQLLAMGNKYMMQDLIDECVQIICKREIWTISYILPIFKAACLYENLPLLLQCYQKIKNNYRHLLNHATFFDLTLLELKRLVVFSSQHRNCNLPDLVKALESYGNYHNLRNSSPQSKEYAEFLELKIVAMKSSTHS